MEIKKYHSSGLSEWCLYSEPIIKVAEEGVSNTVLNVFGSKESYNKFIKDLYDNMVDNGTDISLMEALTKSTIGIQCIDKFIPKSNLEYKWVIVNVWRGWNRLTLFFRKKD